MNCWNLRLWRKTVSLRLTENEEKCVCAAHRRFGRIVKLCVVVPVFSQLLHTLHSAGTHVVESAENDRLSRTNFRTRGREAAFLSVVTKRALKGAAGIWQGFRPTIDHTEGTGDDAVSAAVANIILHEYRADLGAHDGAGWTRFETTGFLAMLANVRKKNPAKRILPVTVD